MNETIRQKREILATLQRHLERDDSNSDVLDSKAQVFFGASSLIVALTGALQILSTVRSLPIVPLGLLLLVYLFHLGMSILALFPREFGFPVQAEWDNVFEYIEMEEDDYLNQLIGDHIDAIAHNHSIIRQKASSVRLAAYSMGALVVMVLVLAIAVQILPA